MFACWRDIVYNLGIIPGLVICKGFVTKSISSSCTNRSCQQGCVRVESMPGRWWLGRAGGSCCRLVRAEERQLWRLWPHTGLNHNIPFVVAICLANFLAPGPASVVGITQPV